MYNYYQMVGGKPTDQTTAISKPDAGEVIDTYMDYFGRLIGIIRGETPQAETEEVVLYDPAAEVPTSTPYTPAPTKPNVGYYIVGGLLGLGLIYGVYSYYSKK